MAQTVKNSPAMQETLVWSLGWEDPLEEDMETHSSILAWRIPWAEEPGGLQSIGSQRVGYDWGDWALTHIEYNLLILTFKASVSLCSYILYISLFFISWAVIKVSHQDCNFALYIFKPSVCCVVYIYCTWILTHILNDWCGFVAVSGLWDHNQL